MVRNRVWGATVVCGLVCGLVWAAGEPARGGRTVPDAEATQIYGGQTTAPICAKIWRSKPCDTGTNCSTSANTYIPTDQKTATTAAPTSNSVYCGTGENCGLRSELEGCDIKKK